MSKLTDMQKRKIVFEYANSQLEIDTNYLAKKYNVSKSTISEVLHYFIGNCLVRRSTAIKIADKAKLNYTIIAQRLDIRDDGKTKRKYDELLKKYDSIISLNESLLSDYEQELGHLLFLLKNYDDVYCSSDEFPLSKKELESKIYELKISIAEITDYIHSRIGKS